MITNLFIVSVLAHSVGANTLTFLFENEFNETTSMAQCRNSIDLILQTPFGFDNFWTYSGKSLNNLGDMESCQKVAGGEYMLVELKGDVYNETLFTKGGRGYFYPKTTSFIGICIPKLCEIQEISFLKSYFFKQGILFGYKPENL